MTTKTYVVIACLAFLTSLIDYQLGSSHESLGKTLDGVAAEIQSFWSKGNEAALRVQDLYAGLNRSYDKLHQLEQQKQELDIGVSLLEADLQWRAAGRTVCRRDADNEPVVPCQPRSKSEISNALAHATAVRNKTLTALLAASNEHDAFGRGTAQLTNEMKHADSTAYSILSRQQWYGRIPSGDYMTDQGIAVVKAAATGEFHQAKTWILTSLVMFLLGLTATAGVYTARRRAAMSD